MTLAFSIENGSHTPRSELTVEAIEGGDLNRLIADVRDGAVVTRQGCAMIAGDARTVLRAMPSDSISCTITSPPYGALKNYGSKDQIGFGQSYTAEYLPALRDVFTSVHRVSKPGAALWVVLDTLKDGGTVTPLPWQVGDIAREVGWTLHDLVVWDKGRTLPWSHHGRFRNVFEYILLLGKGPLANFNLDAVRETDSLGPYWVRYPERYHPEGKAPTDLWHFPIPIQGSWDKGGVRHSCPFPVGLVARMVSLSSKPGDVILDCFAGSGTVPATASVMNRAGIGIELNDDFVASFRNGGCARLVERARVELTQTLNSRDLRTTIVHLRMQKFAKTLFAELARTDRMNGEARKQIRAFVLREAEILRVRGIPGTAYSVGRIKLEILAQKGADLSALRAEARACASVRPLSKFGIESEIEIRSHNAWSAPEYAGGLPRGQWYLYRCGRFHLFDEAVPRRELHQRIVHQAQDTKARYPALLSPLKLDVAQPGDGG